MDKLERIDAYPVNAMSSDETSVKLQKQASDSAGKTAIDDDTSGGANNQSSSTLSSSPDLESAPIASAALAAPGPHRHSTRPHRPKVHRKSSPTFEGGRQTERSALAPASRPALPHTLPRRRDRGRVIVGVPPVLSVAFEVPVLLALQN